MSRYSRWWILSAALILAVGTLVGCGGPKAPEAAVPEATEAAPAPATEAMTQTNPNDLGGRTIRIGTDATYPPMELEEDGQIVGIDPSLMAEICKIANCVPEWKNTPWEGIFPAMAAGEFDVLMSSITILPERETNSNAKFTTPYFTVGQVILVKKDNTTIHGVADLATAHVGVQTGTTGDTAAASEGKVPEANLNKYDTMPLAVQALKSGDVDAVVLDNPTAESYASTFADELMVVGDQFTTEDYGILVSDKFPEILTAFNNAIGQLKAAGTIDTIAKGQMKLYPTPAPGTDGMSATDAMTATEGTTGTGTTP